MVPAVLAGVSGLVFRAGLADRRAQIHHIPFCEWFFIPYCSWFFLLAGVTALLWWYDTPAYKKLCAMMFSGMTFCLIVYMIWPNGLQLRPDPAALGRENLGTAVMQLLWGADDPNNVCPSIHCQSSAAMALTFAKSRFGRENPALVWVAFGHRHLLWGGAGHSVVFCAVPPPERRRQSTGCITAARDYKKRRRGRCRGGVLLFF